MKDNGSAHIVSVGGILTALAVLFQSAPVFLPGVGLILSPFATLPIALASVSSAYSGIIALFTTAFILMLIDPQEAVIFLLTTGLLGLVMGSYYKKGIVQSITAAAVSLFTGINVMVHIAGIAAFGDLTPDSSFITAAGIFLVFSVFYSVVWTMILRFFVKILGRQLDMFRLVKNK